MEETNTYSNPYSSDQPAKPNNNMPLSVISAMIGFCSPLCCIIGLGVGIASIVFSSQVNTKYTAGDYTGAQSSAKTAKTLAFVAIALGIIGIIYTIYQIQSMGGIDATMEHYQEMFKQFEQ